MIDHLDTVKDLTCNRYCDHYKYNCHPYPERLFLTTCSQRLVMRTGIITSFHHIMYYCRFHHGSSIEFWPLPPSCRSPRKRKSVWVGPILQFAVRTILGEEVIKLQPGLYEIT